MGTASQAAEKSVLPLILGGAAVRRCGNRTISNTALAAGGMRLPNYATTYFRHYFRHYF
jgi:hypothetical protein